MRYLYTVDGDWVLELKIFGRVIKEPAKLRDTILVYSISRY